MRLRYTSFLWGVALATLLIFLTMRLWLVPSIEAEAGGLRIFDGCLFGYSFEEAKQFLAALSDQGRALYLGPFGLADTAFPLLSGLMVFIVMQRNAGTLGFWLGACFGIAIILLDLAENFYVRQMLLQGPFLDPMLVERASMLTIAKWVSYGAGFAAMLLKGCGFSAHKH